MDLKALNDFSKNTVIDLLGIEITKVEGDFIEGRMPVTSKTHQPMGILHGGVSVVFIETLGSVGSSIICHESNYFPVGLEVNANHVGGISNGNLIGKAKIVHKGKSTHLWTVELREEGTDRLISTGRLTVMIVEKK